MEFLLGVICCFGIVLVPLAFIFSATVTSRGQSIVEANQKEQARLQQAQAEENARADALERYAQEQKAKAAAKALEEESARLARVHILSMAEGEFKGEADFQKMAINLSLYRNRTGYYCFFAIRRTGDHQWEWMTTHIGDLHDNAKLEELKAAWTSAEGYAAREKLIETSLEELSSLHDGRGAIYADLIRRDWLGADSAEARDKVARRLFHDVTKFSQELSERTSLAAVSEHSWMPNLEAESSLPKVGTWTPMPGLLASKLEPAFLRYVNSSPAGAPLRA